MDTSQAIEEIKAIERRYAPASGMTPAAYKAQLAEARQRGADSEFRMTVGDDGIGEAVAGVLCARYGLTPFRRPRQRDSTLCVSAPESFVREVLLPQTEAILRLRAQIAELRFLARELDKLCTLQKADPDRATKENEKLQPNRPERVSVGELQLAFAEVVASFADSSPANDAVPAEDSAADSAAAAAGAAANATAKPPPGTSRT